MLKFLTPLLALIMLFLQSTYAAENKSLLNKNVIGNVKKWTILRATPHNNNVCYAILYVSERKGNQKSSDETPYIMVHYFSENKMRFSAYFGFKVNETRPIHLSMDSIQYKIKPLEFYAITQSLEQEDEIITHMKKAQTILLRAEGENYSYSIDRYDIDGFNEVFQMMQSNCSFHADNSSFKTIIPSKKDIKKVEVGN